MRVIISSCGDHFQGTHTNHLKYVCWLYVSYTTTAWFFSKYEQSSKHIWWYLFRAWNSSRDRQASTRSIPWHQIYSLPSYFIAIFSLNTTCLYPTSLLLVKPSLSAEICSSQSLWNSIGSSWSSSNAFSIKPLGLPQPCVWLPPRPPRLFFKLYSILLLPFIIWSWLHVLVLTS